MKSLVNALIQFRNQRDWERFHTPENLAKSIVIESAELLEIFQWGSENISLSNVKEEIADILIYAIYLTEHYGFNIETIIQEKMKKNALKYPLENSPGT